MDWDNYFVINPNDPRLKIYVEVMMVLFQFQVLNFEMHCLSSAASQIQ